MMSKTEQLLSRQFKRWNLDQQLMEQVKKDEQAAKPASPVVTISREMGAGGVTTGQIVANELGWAYYDKEIIEQISDQTGSSHRHIAAYDEGHRDAVSSMMLNLLDSRNVSDTVYLRSLVKVLKEISKQGRAVVIGRGGSYVLRDSIRVRLIAPFELRVQRMALVRGVSQKEAEHIVLDSDHAKKRFLRHFFSCSPNDPLLYDLMINTGTLSLDHAAQLIITRVRQTWKED